MSFSHCFFALTLTSLLGAVTGQPTKIAGNAPRTPFHQTAYKRKRGVPSWKVAAGTVGTLALLVVIKKLSVLHRSDKENDSKQLSRGEVRALLERYAPDLKGKMIGKETGAPSNFFEYVENLYLETNLFTYLPGLESQEAKCYAAGLMRQVINAIQGFDEATKKAELSNLYLKLEKCCVALAVSRLNDTLLQYAGIKSDSLIDQYHTVISPFKLEALQETIKKYDARLIKREEDKTRTNAHLQFPHLTHSYILAFPKLGLDQKVARADRNANASYVNLDQATFVEEVKQALNKKESEIITCLTKLTNAENKGALAPITDRAITKFALNMEEGWLEKNGLDNSEGTDLAYDLDKKNYQVSEEFVTAVLKDKKLLQLEAQD